MATSKHWQVQEAKNKFSQVMDSAIHNGPQVITLRGKEAAVLISINDYKKICCRPKKTLLNILLDSPLRDSGIDLKRRKDFSRDVDL